MTGELHVALVDDAVLDTGGRKYRLMTWQEIVTYFRGDWPDDGPVPCYLNDQWWVPTW